MKTILFMIRQQPPGQKLISKEQLLVLRSFIAFNGGKVDGGNKRGLSGSAQEGVMRALILYWDLLLLPLEQKMEGRKDFFMTS